MKLFFTKKNFMQKIIICIVMVLLVNFTLAPSFSHANGLTDDLGNIFFNVLLRVGDAAVWIVQKVVYGIDNSFIEIDRETNWGNIAAGVFAGLGLLAAAVGIGLATAGVGSAALIAGLIAGGTVVGVGGRSNWFIRGIYGRSKRNSRWWSSTKFIFTNNFNFTRNSFF